jgi:ribonuclease HII
MPSILRDNSEQYVPDNLRIENMIWARGINHIAGIDEAGCGPLAGPVVAAAIILPQNFYEKEVKDSKKLTPKKRILLHDLLIKNAISYAIGVVHSYEIDKFNIRKATFKAMRKAIGSLKLKPGYLLFDGYELPEKLFLQEAFINGDNLSFTIAAASIIAKVSRDQLMLAFHEEFPQYGFNRHKGYGTAYHIKMLRKYGVCPIHRRSFLRKIL